MHFLPELGKMLAGIAFILLAMNIMESSLNQLTGRRFKLFLKKQTDNKIKAIGCGAVITGILQSSSIVNLLVLSMAGAGILKMENALAVVLGANLGSTVNSWIVALFGFNFNIEDFALFLAGFAGIGMAFYRAESKGSLWFRFVFSLAFLFVALGFLKSGMEDFVKQIDLSVLAHFPVILFLILGIILTGLVQTGSVTIALTLSALHTNAITLYAATAIVLGSEIGTTLKLFIASAKGHPEKKQIALGNFLFNVVTTGMIFLLLHPVNELISGVLAIKDELIALVLFQTLVNVTSILLFYPSLGLLGKFLVKRYPDNEDDSFYINKLSVVDIDIAIEALENEAKNFITLVIHFCFDSFGKKEYYIRKTTEYKRMYSKSLTDKYFFIKNLYGEMHGFYLKIMNNPVRLEKMERMERLDQLVTSIRNGMYAAKSVRDARYDIKQISNSSNNIKYDFYVKSSEKSSEIYGKMLLLMDEMEQKKLFDELTLLYKTITEGYSATLQLLYKESLVSLVSETEISTLINFNREIYTSYKSLLYSIKDYLLSVEQADYFDNLPGFIR